MPGKETRQCKAELHSYGQPQTRCILQVTEATTHVQDHTDGNVSWTDSCATLPDVPASERRICGIQTPYGPCELESNHGGLCGDAGRVPASGRQVGGNHYRKFKIQPWDIIDEYGLSFYAGSVLKYLLRAGHKDWIVEDLRKARHYLDKLIELEEARDGEE